MAWRQSDHIRSHARREPSEMSVTGRRRPIFARRADKYRSFGRPRAVRRGIIWLGKRGGL